MIDLDVFRTAKTLRWVQHTVFAQHRGDDGNLIAEENKIPLDTWLPSETRTEDEATPEGGIAVVDPETVEDLHNAIRSWCARFIGRDDVEFPA